MDLCLYRILQGYWKSQEPVVAWGRDVGMGCCRTSIKTCVCFFSFLHSLISAVYFLFPLYFCLSYYLCSLLSHNLVVKPNWI